MVIPYNIYNVICWIITTICAFLMLIIFIYHFRKAYQHNSGILSFKKIKSKPSIYVSFGMLFMGLIFLMSCIHMTYAETYPLSRLQCGLIKYTTFITYTIFKALLYIILIIRLWMIFHGTSLINYKKRWLVILGIIVIFWTIIENVTNHMWTTSIYNEHNLCRSEFSATVVFAVATLDFSTTIIYAILFTKPMLTIHRNNRRTTSRTTITSISRHSIKKTSCSHSAEHRHSNIDNEDHLNLKYIAIKQCILSIIAVGSTCIGSTLVYIFHMTQVWSALDIIVSSICIILMYRWHNELYLYGCGKCADLLMDYSERRYLNKLTNNKEITITDKTNTTSGDDERNLADYLEQHVHSNTDIQAQIFEPEEVVTPTQFDTSTLSLGQPHKMLPTSSISVKYGSDAENDNDPDLNDEHHTEYLNLPMTSMSRGNSVSVEKIDNVNIDIEVHQQTDGM